MSGDVALEAGRLMGALDACRGALADHAIGRLSDAQLQRTLLGTGLVDQFERLVAAHPDGPGPGSTSGDAMIDKSPVAGAAQLPFRATHVVPATGMRTWAEPGDALPGPSLDPGLHVQLVRMWGDWAHIGCDNGWTAWVDARHLVPAGAPAGAARSAPSTSSRNAPSAPQGQRFVTPSKATWPVSAGAAAVALGAFLPWFDLGAGLPTQSAFDGALKYLVDYENPGTGLRIGLALLLIAGGAFVARHMRGWEKAVRPLAAAGVAICAVFVVQTQRLLGAAEDVGGVAPGVLDVVGVGVWISLAGAALLTWGASRG